VKLIKGGRDKGVDNSNPNYDPKLFRKENSPPRSNRLRTATYVIIFTLIIAVVTYTIDMTLFKNQ